MHAGFIPGDGDLSVEEIPTHVVAGDKDGHNLTAMPDDVPLDLRTHERQTMRVAGFSDPLRLPGVGFR